MHIPVLLKETIDGLDPKKGDIIFDGTFGLGGHSLEICQQTGGQAKIIATDLNTKTLEKAGEILKSKGCNISLHVSNFRNLDKVLETEKIESIDKYLFDLGWSSELLEEGGRGFSFMKDEPLLMTYSDSPNQNDLTAHDIVNSWDRENIELILRNYGEERFASKISKAIESARQRKEIESTFDLVEVIRNAVPIWYRNRRIHFATKTFQALRMAVNDEIGSLIEALQKSWKHLNSRGRIAVISFHSLEDRTVKRYFKDLVKEGVANFINKKPIQPSKEEIKQNPRARSAKLRVIEKI